MLYGMNIVQHKVLGEAAHFVWKVRGGTGRGSQGHGVEEHIGASSTCLLLNQILRTRLGDRVSPLFLGSSWRFWD